MLDIFFSAWCELTKIMIVLLVITLSTWLCGDKRFADALIFYYNSGKKKEKKTCKKNKKHADQKTKRLMENTQRECNFATSF